MKLLFELDENDKGTPIEKANAIIRWHMDQAYISTEEDLVGAQEELCELVEHIQTWLKYNLIENNKGFR